MGMLTTIRDSFVNLISGLGTWKDPTTALTYKYTELNRNDVESAYRSNWIARAVVNAPAEDSTREWRAWQASQEEIEAIEEVEKRHFLQKKMRQALIRARLYGGAALVMGVEDGGETWEPLDLDGVTEDSLKWVVVMNRYELNAGQRIYDVESEWYTEPEYYTVSTPTAGIGTTTQGPKPALGIAARMHPSRVVVFHGNELPDWRLATLGGSWGDSVLQTLDETLKDFGLSIGGIANMINDAKMDVIRIPEFSKRIADQKYRDNLFTRFTTANVAKSTLNSLIMDKEEEWERITTNFSGLPQVIQMLMPIVSAAGGIPVSRLMGQAPGKGLSTATSGGESDLYNYYDGCTSKQKTEYSPAMTPLDQVLIRSALGKYDPSVYYNWNPLYRPDPKDVASIALQKAQATTAIVNTGLINEDVMREALVNQLLEDETYPGLDDAIDEYGAEPDEPEVGPEDVQNHIAMLQQSSQQLKQLAGPAQQAMDARRLLGDATPRTLYVRRDVVNGAEIVAWAKSQGFATTLPADQLHVTVAYSRTPVDWMRAREDRWARDDDNNMTVPASSVRMVDVFGQPPDTAVLLFNSARLSARHDDFSDIGATWQWPEYQPHISISQNLPADFDASKVVPYRGPIVLGPEVFEEVKSGWGAGITEDGR